MSRNLFVSRVTGYLAVVESEKEDLKFWYNGSQMAVRAKLFKRALHETRVDGENDIEV